MPGDILILSRSRPRAVRLCLNSEFAGNRTRLSPNDTTWRIGVRSFAWALATEGAKRPSDG